MSRVIVVGSSGHAGVVLEALELEGKHEVVGLLDSFQPVGEKRHGYSICGCSENAKEVSESLGCELFFVAIGDNWSRSQVSDQVMSEIPNAKFVTVIHPGAIVSKSASIAPGSVVLAGAVVNRNCEIGAGCILNTACSVDHECVLNDYASVGPGAHVAGNVSIGSRSFIGIGAAVREKISVGSDSLVGAGSVLLHSVTNNVLVYGAPAKVIRERASNERCLL